MATPTEYCSFQSELATGTVTRRTISQRTSEKCINPLWIFIGRADADAEAPIFWPHDVKSQLTGKDPNAGKDWRQDKGMTEDKIVGFPTSNSWTWGHEVEQAPGDGEGQGSLLCCSPLGHKELDMTERLNNKETHSIHPPIYLFIHLSISSPIGSIYPISHFTNIYQVLVLCRTLVNAMKEIVS